MKEKEKKGKMEKGTTTRWLLYLKAIRAGICWLYIFGEPRRASSGRFLVVGRSALLLPVPPCCPTVVPSSFRLSGPSFLCLSLLSILPWVLPPSTTVLSMFLPFSVALWVSPRVTTTTTTTTTTRLDATRRDPTVRYVPSFLFILPSPSITPLSPSLSLFHWPRVSRSLVATALHTPP